MGAQADRVRGRRLQRRRRRHFAAHPLCARCGRRPATELDHIVPICRGGRDGPPNLQGLCGACHAAKTRQDMGHRPTGCDTRGQPTDPAHPWHEGGREEKSQGTSRKPLATLSTTKVR